MTNAIRLEADHERLRLLAADLSVQSREARVQLNTLSPLARVGRIIVSDKPARPRQLRAIVILLLLGLAASLFISPGGVARGVLGVCSVLGLYTALAFVLFAILLVATALQLKLRPLDGGRS